MFEYYKMKVIAGAESCFEMTAYYYKIKQYDTSNIRTMYDEIAKSALLFLLETETLLLNCCNAMNPKSCE